MENMPCKTAIDCAIYTTYITCALFFFCEIVHTFYFCNEFVHTVCSPCDLLVSEQTPMYSTRAFAKKDLNLVIVCRKDVTS